LKSYGKYKHGRHKKMRLVIAVMIAVMAVISIGQGPAEAVDMVNYCSIPPFVARQGPPLVTIVMGRDHKLYYEAYNDACDLDGDGDLELGYTHDIEMPYYGYFDSFTCYTYDGNKFIPSGTTTDMYCSGNWSGNFLNWLSMSRMDVLRKVLYGGHRQTSETASETILEGAYIPQDAHSWGKEYAGDDTAQLTPFSAPTSGNRHLFCVTSIEENQAHMIRVTQNVPERIWEWASTERAVCSGDETPSSYRHWGNDTAHDYTINDYMVRVKACVDSTEFSSTPSDEDYEKYLERCNCQKYTDYYKPVGLLQKYGVGDGVTKVCSKTFKPCTTSANCGTDDGDCIDLAKMYFALITGSYKKNMSGGVLRRVMGDISDEIYPATGVFNLTENTTKGNIIRTLEELRVWGFNYDDEYPGAGDYAYDAWEWSATSPMDEADDAYRMWGNPIGEMMYEALRYFADAGDATSAFDATPLSAVDLPTPSWDEPFEKFPWCSKPSMLVISDINPSFDSDQLPGSAFGSFSGTGELTGLNVSTLTNTIGNQEGITEAFIGQSGGDNDNICSSKTCSDMGQIRGLCPEEPTKQGSYYAAAVAYYGKRDFKNLLLVDAVDEDDKIYYPPVTTYSVALASPIPDITIQVGSNTVTLVPAGKSVSGCCGVRGSCADKCTLAYDANSGLVISGCTDGFCPSNQIVDFYVDEITSTSGTFRINFEDVEQGADHDMDAIVLYEYEVLDSSTVRIRLTCPYGDGCIDQILGFFISGTSEDGLYLGVKDADVGNVADAETPAVVADMPTEKLCNNTLTPCEDDGDCSDGGECKDISRWTRDFTVSGEPAALLKDPLWYAAKWGGFNDIDGLEYADDPKEWDRDGNDVPDNYFLVHNPLELENQLNEAFGEILKRVSSGTAVSVLSTSAGGEGALFQAYFNPSVFDAGREVTWVGYLNALWVDQYGNLREDRGGGTGENEPDQHLVLTKDPIVVYDLDGDGDTVVRKYADSDGDGEIDDPNDPLGIFSLADLQPLWEGGEALAKRTTSRDIYTYIDEDGDMVVDDGEFDKDKFDADDKDDLYTYLNAEGATVDDRKTHAEKIIRFIRGESVETEDSNYRDRRLMVDGSLEVWRLGDIVYSTPTVVGRPMENYHLIYGDTTYLDYVREHKDRKTVIYVGANDGMLHAFSAGAYHEGNDSTTGDTEQGWYSGDFGTELWAYIPYNLLPQLKWLCDLTYCHAYYVDLKAKVVDARIFDEDDDHPNGWGTVLIGAMRLGGKAITRTDTYDGSTSEERSFRSAYFAIDVTVPDTPDLLWEFTDGNLNFTTSYPAVFRVGTAKPFDTNTGDWYVIFGSGPTTFEGAGAATGYVYVRKLSDGTPARTFTVDVGVGNPVFMASPITIDLGLNYQVDVAYIGASYYDSTELRWEGKIYRIKINESTTAASWTWSPFVSFDQPITIAPAAALDPFNRLWLYWGTGRFFSGGDKTDTTTQRLYGVWDPGTEVNATGDPPAKLKDVTEIKVYEGGYMIDVTPTTFNGYLVARRGNYSAESLYGWYLKMTSPIALDGERAINTATVLGDIVLFPTFKPEADICAFGGDSYLYALYYETGTAYWKSIIGVDEADEVDDNYKVLKKSELGKGMPTSVVVHAGQEEGVKGMVQLGTGVVKVLEIDPASSPQSKVLFWREKTD